MSRTITNLRKSMVRQMRTLHESGNQVDPVKFRNRWRRRWKEALLKDVEALQDFIENKVVHEVHAAARKLKEQEGLDFAFTPQTVGAFGVASTSDQEHVVHRRTEDLLSRQQELTRLVKRYGLSKVYEAFIAREHDEQRQRKLAKLDSFIRSS